MIVIGIDPGSISTGYSVIKDNNLIDYGMFKPKGKDLSTRLGIIFTSFTSLILKYKPDVVVIESQFVGMKNSILSLAKSQGVILACCGVHNIKVVSYTPTQIKKAVTGKGNSKKQEVMLATKNYFTSLNSLEFIEKGKNKNDDLFDSIAIALTYILDKGDNNG